MILWDINERASVLPDFREVIDDLVSSTTSGLFVEPKTVTPLGRTVSEATIGAVA